MKPLILLFALSLTMLTSCIEEPASGVPGSIRLTVTLDPNCTGKLAWVEVKLNAAVMGTLQPGGPGLSDDIAPAYYSIIAQAYNADSTLGKRWAEDKTLVKSYTYNCSCP